ncbi:MAG: helix-turn-helix domain-containing protein [Saprospiraceae bacterium]
MPIIVNVDVMLAKRKMKSKDLADAIGITVANLSILKTGKAKAVRFSTLAAICKELDCQPGDILEYRAVE